MHGVPDAVADRLSDVLDLVDGWNRVDGANR